MWSWQKKVKYCWEQPNEDEYSALFRLLKRTKGFSLNFIFLDDQGIEEEIRRRLKVNFNIREISLTDTDDIFLWLKQNSYNLEENEALSILNLSPVINNPKKGSSLLNNLNLLRDNLTKILKNPILIWLKIGDEAIFLRNSPDLWSWRGGSFYFYSYYPDKDFNPDREAPDFQSYIYQNSLKEITKLEYELKEEKELNEPTVSSKRKRGAVKLRLSEAYFKILKKKEAIKEGEEALKIYQKIGNLQGEANCMQGEGMVLISKGEIREGVRLFEKSLKFFEKINDTYSQANVLLQLCNALIGIEGEKERTIGFMKKAAKLFKSIKMNDRAEEINIFIRSL